MSYIVFPVDRGGTRMSLAIYDVLGRRVRRLLDRELAPGEHAIQWRGDDDGGRRVGPGIYLYELRQDGRVASGRLVRLAP